jgi:hypothetical protein
LGYETPPSNPSGKAFIYFTGWVEKIDANRNPVWQWGSLDSFSYESQLNVIKEMPSGIFLIFGNRRMIDMVGNTFTDEHTKGWFLTLNTNGDSLKQRSYSGITSSWDKNYFNDAKQTSDGGFIMVGESTDMSPNAIKPIQRGWLVKVDSNAGPGDPQCWPVGIPFSPVAGNETRVYPNPVSGLLNIAYYNTTAAGSLFMLTDVTGKVLLTQTLAGSTGAESIDVSRLVSGIYLYRIVEDKVTTAQGKVIKQ